MIHHLDAISHGEVRFQQLEHVVHSNSEHLMMNMLKYTDLCTLSIDFSNGDFMDNGIIRKINVNCCKNCVNIGFVTRYGYVLQWFEEELIQWIKKLFQ